VAVVLGKLVFLAALVEKAGTEPPQQLVV